jgi:hypothetical protein
MDEEPKDAAGQPESAIDRVLLEYVRDPGLWPVLVVLVLVAATLGATLLLFALRLHNLFALTALAIALVMSAGGLEPSVRARRLRAAGGFVLGFWAASAALAAGLVALGAF